VSRPLQIAGCRSLCDWRDTGARLATEPVFACLGCGSEWVPSEEWTPVDYTGVVPDAVVDARGSTPVRRERGRG
jgi:hypothetical protein